MTPLAVLGPHQPTTPRGLNLFSVCETTECTPLALSAWNDPCFALENKGPYYLVPILRVSLRVSRVFGILGTFTSSDALYVAATHSLNNKGFTGWFCPGDSWGGWRLAVTRGGVFSEQEQGHSKPWTQERKLGSVSPFSPLLSIMETLECGSELRPCSCLKYRPCSWQSERRPGAELSMAHECWWLCMFFKLDAVFQSHEGPYQMQMSAASGEADRGTLETGLTLLNGVGGRPRCSHPGSCLRASHLWAGTGVFLVVEKCPSPPFTRRG